MPVHIFEVNLHLKTEFLNSTEKADFPSKGYSLIQCNFAKEFWILAFFSAYIKLLSFLIRSPCIKQTVNYYIQPGNPNNGKNRSVLSFSVETQIKIRTTHKMLCEKVKYWLLFRFLMNFCPFNKHFQTAQICIEKMSILQVFFGQIWSNARPARSIEKSRLWNYA